MSRMKYQASDFSKNTNSNLPSDIISDILSRLPVKPLIRFKSVSKTWYALVENPHFIKKHYARSKQNLTSVLVTERPIGFKAQKYRRVNYSKTYRMWLEYRNNKTVNLGHNFSFEENYPRVLGICNGLVCFTLKHSEYFICNPTTRGFRKILGPSLQKVGTLYEVRGFLIHDDDYKLLRIMDSEVGFRAEVYSMNNDIWSEIEVNTRNIDFRMRICVAAMPVTINEVLYWVDHRCVLSFDMNEYNFGTIDFPEMGIFCSNWRIHDVKGELAMTVGVYKCFKMWVLNEKEQSWTLKIKGDDFPSLGQSLSLLGCERNGNLKIKEDGFPSIGQRLSLLECERNGNLIMRHLTPDRDVVLLSFDPESRKITYLPFQGLKNGQIIYMYMESLALV